MLFIFDMGGVVTNTFKMDSLWDSLKMTRENFFDLCKHSEQNIWLDFEKGNLSSKEFWDSFNEIIKDNPKYNLIYPIKHDLFRLFFHPVRNPIIEELINRLKKKHRVVCGTNTNQSHWENHMECGDYALFNQTYASNKIFSVKPDLEFFQLIMDAEGYSPSETFFTDDKEENCKAAISLGINTVHFSTPQDLVSKWEKYC